MYGAEHREESQMPYALTTQPEENVDGHGSAEESGAVNAVQAWICHGPIAAPGCVSVPHVRAGFDSFGD